MRLASSWRVAMGAGGGKSAMATRCGVQLGTVLALVLLLLPASKAQTASQRKFGEEMALASATGYLVVETGVALASKGGVGSYAAVPSKRIWDDDDEERERHTIWWYPNITPGVATSSRKNGNIIPFGISYEWAKGNIGGEALVSYYSQSVQPVQPGSVHAVFIGMDIRVYMPLRRSWPVRPYVGLGVGVLDAPNRSRYLDGQYIDDRYFGFAGKLAVGVRVDIGPVGVRAGYNLFLPFMQLEEVQSSYGPYADIAVGVSF